MRRLTHRQRSFADLELERQGVRLEPGLAAISALLDRASSDLLKVVAQDLRASLATAAPRTTVPIPPRVALGGKSIEIRELCFVHGKIEGLDFVSEAVPIDDIGRADGHELDVLIGARTMEQWEIKLDPKTGTLDLGGLRRREFTEF